MAPAPSSEMGEHTRRPTTGFIAQSALATVTLFLVTAQPAAGEVYDKVPSTVGLWVSGSIAALASVVAWQWRRWLGLLLVPVSLFLIVSRIGLLTDPYVGPAVRAELGASYAWTIGLTTTLLVGAHAVGFWLARVRARNASAAA